MYHPGEPKLPIKDKAEYKRRTLEDNNGDVHQACIFKRAEFCEQCLLVVCLEELHGSVSL
jgi:hypothetical protein